MVTKSEAIFIYVAKGTKASGSPYTVEMTRKVKVDIRSTFSNKYYFERGREMRNAMNIICNTYNTLDITEDEMIYSLTYVVMKGIKYTVENILNNWKNYQDDPFHKVLDLKKAL